MTPILKSSRPPNLLGSFRPLNNLVSLEKLWEEHMRIHLHKFLDANMIINDNHHGGRKNHSTITALIQIHDFLYKQYDENRICTTLTTDLTAAFDTVNSNFLLQKLEFYGIRDNELDMFRSYLSDRRQFVEIDTFRSSTIESPPCSVVQGSKLSMLLYTIYTNEIPLLQNLMGDNIFTEITGYKCNKFSDVKQLTVNFVDDTSSMISSGNSSYVKSYLSDYYNLLHNYYLINHLFVNGDKTNLLLTMRPKFRYIFKNFTFIADGFVIVPKNVIKVLGIFIRSDLKLDTQVGIMAGNLHNRIFELTRISGYLNFKTRLSFVKSFVMGKLQYAMPLYKT